MSHLPDIGLKTWKQGDRLSAEALNGNFQALLALIETAMHTALTPDPVAVANEVGLDVLDQRVRGLEHLTAMHARQRNEREYAPLSHVGALVAQVNQLRRDLEAACEQLLAAKASIDAMHADQERRLQRLEQQPEAAPKTDHDSLFKEHQRLAEKEHMLMAQVIAIRSETTALTKMAMGHKRQRNEMEYAPLAAVGFIIQQLNEIRAKLP